MGVIINGITYNVEISGLSRSYRKDYKYKVTTEDGMVHSEIRAVYMDFDLSLGNIDATAYDNLMAVLRSTTGNCSVILPSSSKEVGVYIGEFNGVKDEIITQNDTETFWDNLTLSFSGTVPLEVEP